jgi:hypothetical protein
MLWLLFLKCFSFFFTQEDTKTMTYMYDECWVLEGAFLCVKMPCMDTDFISTGSNFIREKLTHGIDADL